MAVKFTEKECGEIVQALRLAAARHAANGGMRKTTVDELAEEAGISKGAFYKFYSSKEYLFLDMLEQWHENISQRAGEELKRCADLTPRERAAAMLKTAVRAMRITPLEHFMREEIPLLLRKMPEEVGREHYLSDEDFVRQMIRKANVRLSVPETIAYAAVRLLFLSQLTADQVGEGYEEAVDKLIDGACATMIVS